MKKQYYFYLFLCFFLVSKSTINAQGIGQYTDQISKLGGELPNQEIVKMIDKLYEQKVLNEQGRNQFKLFVEQRTLPEIIKKKEGEEASKIDRVKMFAPILLGKDSTKMNRNVILALLGMIDMANMEDKITKSNSVKGGELNNILGEKWNFKPVTEGDNENPFSIKIDMDKNRENYSKLLDGINNSGLLDAKVYADAKKWLDKKELFILKDFSILLYATVRSVYYDSYEMLKTSQSKAIDSLALAGVIQPSELSSLKQKYADFNLLTKTEIFKKNTAQFSLNKNEVDFQNKEAVLRKVFEKISVLIPNLKIENLKFENIEGESKKSSNPMAQMVLGQVEKYIDSRKMLVSANFNGKNYIKEIDLIQLNDDMMPDSEMKSTLSKLLNSAWLGKKDLQIFNDFLMDAGSKKRVYVVGDEFSVFPKSNSTEKVVFLMDSVQNAIATKQMPLMRLSLGAAQDFEGLNSLKNLKSTYEDLLSTKLIEPATNQKVESLLLKSRQKQNDFEIKKEVFYNFLNEKPNFFVKGDIFKKEGMMPSFEKFINQLAASSNGAFKPEGIQSNFEEELSSKVDTDTYNFNFSFTVNGKPYTDVFVLEPMNENEIEMNKMFGNSNRFSKIENKILNLVKIASTSHKPYQFNQNGKNYLFLKEEDFANINEKLAYSFEEILVEDEAGIATIDSASEGNYGNSFDPEAFILELKDADMIDDDGIEKLRSKYSEQLPEYRSKFIPFLKNGIEFDILSSLKQPTDVFFKNLYETIRQKFLPEVKLERFNVKLDSMKANYGNVDIFEYFSKVSYTINGINYFDKYVDFENFKTSILAQLEEQDAVIIEQFNFPFSVFNNYLADKESDKRILTFFEENKIYSLFLNQEKFLKLDGYSFGDATYKKVKAEIEKLIELEIFEKASSQEIDEMVNDFRASVSTIYIQELLNILPSKKASYLEVSDSENNLIWYKSLEKLSNNTVIFKNYSDNYAQIFDKIQIENEKESQEDRIEKFELKINFMFNNVKYEEKINLNRDVDYNIDGYLFYEKYFKKLNAELEKMKNSSRFYFDTERVYFLNEAQMLYLKEKGKGFLE